MNNVGYYATMNDTATQNSTLIWTDGEHADLVGRVMSNLPNVEVANLGGPRKGELTELAQQLSATVCDDLREMIVNESNTYLLLATATSIAHDLLLLALERSINVLTIEPPTTQADQVITWKKGQTPNRRIMHLPMWRLGWGWLSAAEPIEVIGSVQSTSLTSIAPPDAGSLYARLYDTVDMVTLLLGMPDSIDACLTSPTNQVPDNLHAITGQLTALLRFANKTGATIHVSDRGTRWMRRQTIVGQKGQLVLDDKSYCLNSGEITEQESIENHDATITAGELIAKQWQWLMDHHYGLNIVDTQQVVATCQAALLSCRTGQSESPEMILRLIAGG